jgi:hypothetical protein
LEKCEGGARVEGPPPCPSQGCLLQPYAAVDLYALQRLGARSAREGRSLVAFGDLLGTRGGIFQIDLTDRRDPEIRGGRDEHEVSPLPGESSEKLREPGRQVEAEG